MALMYVCMQMSMEVSFFQIWTLSFFNLIVYVCMFLLLREQADELCQTLERTKIGHVLPQMADVLYHALFCSHLKDLSGRKTTNILLLGSVRWGRGKGGLYWYLVLFGMIGKKARMEDLNVTKHLLVG